MLDKLSVDGKVLFYYSPVIWIEVLPKIYRLNKANTLKLSRREIIERITAVENTFIQINPSSKAIGIAYLLRDLGHRDMIDNMLYGIALSENLLFMTMDKIFKKFLESTRLRTDIIISHRELFNRVVHRD